jgi:glycosyltransferase involved in cell wall biosynthesis
MLKIFYQGTKESLLRKPKVKKNTHIGSVIFPTEHQRNQGQQLIKLSVITQFYPPDYAATGQLIEELVKHLGLLGVDIDVFTGQPGYAFGTDNAPAVEKSPHIRIKRSYITRMWSNRIRGKTINGVLFTLRAVLHLLKISRNRNLLLLTTAPPFLPILGLLARLFLGIPYVCLLYDLYPDIAIALGVIPKNHYITKLWRFLNQLVWRHAKKIIVLSPTMKQQVVVNCPEVADKICVIHSWADPNLITPIEKNHNWFAHKYNLVNKFSVLYSGNMGRCHDIQTIVDTAKELRNEPIQFVCVGDGAKRQELVREVKELGLEKNFVFLPYQEKNILPLSLTACDLSLVSVNAGFEHLVAPSKLYSALAAGRPVAVICPKHSYLNQVIANAKCGSVFENRNSHELAKFIRTLHSKRELVDSMGKAGRKYMMSNFTPEIISQQYLEILQEAISSGL